MISISNINEINRQKWEQLVSNAPTGNWFQTPEAYDFFAAQPDLFLPFVVAVENADQLIGVCVGYVTVEKNPLKNFATRRAIIVGGPALAADCSMEGVQTLMKQVICQCKKLGAIYIETRNFSDYSPWRSAFEVAGFLYEEHLNFHLDCSDEDALLKQMHESRRRQVKKGLKNGAVIEEASSEEEVLEYYQILLHLYRTKVKTPLFPQSFFLKFYRQDCGKFLLIKYDNHVIGGIMCPMLTGNTIYEWFVCGQDEQYKDQYPSVLATYAAMLYGAQHDMPKFDFMGAGKPGDGYGVRVFKERFGGELVEHGRYKFICKPLLYKCGEMGVKLIKKIK